MSAPATRPVRPALLALLAILAFWLVELACQWFAFGPKVEFGFWGLQSALARTAAIVGSLCIGLVILRRTDLIAPAIILTFAIACVTGPVTWAAILHLGVDPGRFAAMLGLTFLPSALALLWLAAGPGWKRLAGLVPAATLVATLILAGLYLDFTPMVYEPWDESDYAGIDIEALYTAQDGLLDEQFAALAPETPGRPEVFALLLGGTSYQSVFRSEVELAGPILDRNYGSADRTLRLVNSDDDPMAYPLANRTNLARALRAMGDRMGPEDVALLYLTSHGARDRFSLSFYQAGTRDLTAAEFAAMLDESGIGPAVIVIQACYSGSFIDDIAAPDRLIVTAAREDRTSFGCADGRDWTEFGRSFFEAGLATDPDPRKAFALAATDVRFKELRRLAFMGSNPQIAEGAEIGAALDHLLAARLALASP